jgi:hypothetical protein
MRSCPENEDMFGKEDMSGKLGHVRKMRMCPENEDMSGK